MACSVEEVGIACSFGDVREERATPSFNCSVWVPLGKEPTSGEVANEAGTNFLCTVPVPILGSSTGSSGVRCLLYAISLPDEFAVFS
jgi:hypothetical protein